MTAETLDRAHPLRPWSGRFAALPDGVRLAAEPFLAQACLRAAPFGPDPARARVAAGLGIPGYRILVRLVPRYLAAWLVDAATEFRPDT